MAKVLVVKIKEREHRGSGCYQFRNQINMDDYKQVATFLLDLETYGANVEKAIAEFKRLKLSEKEFPYG